MRPIEEGEGIMPPNEEFVLTELEDITLTEMDEILEKYDFVRVVRCRDCKLAYFYEHKEGETGILCTEHDADVTEDDFCSRGERREE